MGAGYHGGFGHSHGENKKIDSMRKPILKRGDVRYNAKKSAGLFIEH